MIRETSEKVDIIRKRMKEAQDRQKSYADQRRRDLEFAVGDLVFVKISPLRNVVRFGKRGKLSPRFVGPFPILERIGTLAYRVNLPEKMAGVHNVFHVSHLRKCVHDSNIVINPNELEELDVEPEASKPRRPVRIMEHSTKQLRRKIVNLVRVQWSEHEGDSTWETEENMRSAYPKLFSGMVTVVYIIYKCCLLVSLVVGMSGC